MKHSELMVAPMRRELTELGFTELRTPAEVDEFMQASKDGTALLVVNSICGCAGGTMRPALGRALADAARPQALGTVFAGRDIEATERGREYFEGVAPSSPAVALFKGGSVVLMLERHDIQGRHPQMVAEELTAAFERHCPARSSS